MQNLHALESRTCGVCGFGEERGAHSGSGPGVRGRLPGSGKAVPRADGRGNSDGRQRVALVVARAPEALLEGEERCWWERQ